MASNILGLSKPSKDWRGKKDIGRSICPKESWNSSWGREGKMPALCLRDWLVLGEEKCQLHGIIQRSFILLLRGVRFTFFNREGYIIWKSQAYSKWVGAVERESTGERCRCSDDSVCGTERIRRMKKGSWWGEGDRTLSWGRRSPESFEVLVLSLDSNLKSKYTEINISVFNDLFFPPHSFVFFISSSTQIILVVETWGISG